MYLSGKTIASKDEILKSEVEDKVYKDCNFSKFEFEGGEISAIFIDCTFKEIKSYFSLFNLCTFLNVKFENCQFEGVSFMSCVFIKCTFTECSLKSDNLGGQSKFEKSDILLSKFEACEMDSVEYLESKIVK